MTPAGLGPAIPGSVGRCLIHWATGPRVLLLSLQGRRAERLGARTACVRAPLSAAVPVAATRNAAHKGAVAAVYVFCVLALWQAC